jgi:hypothetical protein
MRARSVLSHAAVGLQIRFLMWKCSKFGGEVRGQQSGGGCCQSGCVCVALAKEAAEVHRSAAMLLQHRFLQHKVLQGMLRDIAASLPQGYAKARNSGQHTHCTAHLEPSIAHTLCSTCAYFACTVHSPMSPSVEEVACIVKEACTHAHMHACTYIHIRVVCTAWDTHTHTQS